MNLIYLRYAVEVASAGSINRAAEKLCVDQPNLSRAIRELESSLGVSVFSRSPKGMKLTPEGEKFMVAAKSILREVDAAEKMFKKGSGRKQYFSLSSPRASYICRAFTDFSARFSSVPEVEAVYRETNSMRTVKNVLQGESKLGIIRYADGYDRYYKEMCEERGLVCELVAEFSPVLIMRANSPVATGEITEETLSSLIEVAHADPYVPTLPFDEVRREELPEAPRRIFVYERASQFELLAAHPDMYMRVSPVPADILARYGLISRPDPKERVYRDVMIYRKDYQLSALDKAFISELCRVRRETIPGR